MKTTILLSLIGTAVVALSQPAVGRRRWGWRFPRRRFWWWFPRRWRVGVFVAAFWLPNPLQAESGAAVVALALAVPVLAAADFAQPRICMEALILPLEVSLAQPLHSDITTEAAARLLLGHINSPDRQINR